MSKVTSHRLRREIIVVIILKLFALFIIWELFFSHPISHQLSKAQLVERMI